MRQKAGKINLVYLDVLTTRYSSCFGIFCVNVSTKKATGNLQYIHWRFEHKPMAFPRRSSLKKTSSVDVRCNRSGHIGSEF